MLPCTGRRPETASYTHTHTHTHTKSLLFFACACVSLCEGLSMCRNLCVFARVSKRVRVHVHNVCFLFWLPAMFWGYLVVTISDLCTL